MKRAGTEAFRLPPLILHPFSSSEDTSVLMESSRASLSLQGFLPRNESPVEDLDKQLLRGRYAELRMLFYIGKDMTRWTDQCTEVVRNRPVFDGFHVQAESFAVLLIHQTPANVRLKLEAWGVLDYVSLFRRAFALHWVFQEIPPVDLLTPQFLRYYHRYLDRWYEGRLKECVFDQPEKGQFSFDVYASGEYALLLAESWGA
ncbi:MAG: hypothetical protein JO319_18930 [Acidobacteriaceae bacterium]|nr:hypothetical protein [Acidobacteriaceae bacterium]